VTSHHKAASLAIGVTLFLLGLLMMGAFPFTKVVLGTSLVFIAVTFIGMWIISEFVTTKKASEFNLKNHWESVEKLKKDIKGWSYDPCYTPQYALRTYFNDTEEDFLEAKVPAKRRKKKQSNNVVRVYTLPDSKPIWQERRTG
jgi:hypothetical protein